MLIDKWEYVVIDGWAHVYDDYVGPRDGGHYTHFIAGDNPLDIHLPHRSPLRYYYDVALIKVSTGENVLPNGLAHFTEVNERFTVTALTAAEMNAAFGIEAPVTEPGDEGNESEGDGGEMNWPLIIGIAAAALVLIIAVIVVISKKGKK